jgi:hypothetical protein
MADTCFVSWTLSCRLIIIETPEKQFENSVIHTEYGKRCSIWKYVFGGKCNGPEFTLLDEKDPLPSHSVAEFSALAHQTDTDPRKRRRASCLAFISACLGNVALTDVKTRG